MHSSQIDLQVTPKAGLLHITCVPQNLARACPQTRLAIASNYDCTNANEMLCALCRLVDSLYHLLPTEEPQAENPTPNTSLLGLVFLIKAITKAAVLLKAKSKAVNNLLLLPVDAHSDLWGSPNVLEVRIVLCCCYCCSAWLA